MTESFSGYPSGPPEPKKTNKTTIIVVAIVGAVVIILCCIFGIFSLASNTNSRSSKLWIKPSTSNGTTLPYTPTMNKDEIEEGTWSVGPDINPGTFRTESASNTCYWTILKSNTNEHDIVDSHFGGGNLTVVLKEGQDFKSERCGTWKKVG